MEAKLMGMLKTDLMKECKDLGLDCKQSMTKDRIVSILSEHYNENQKKPPKTRKAAGTKKARASQVKKARPAAKTVRKAKSTFGPIKFEAKPSVISVIPTIEYVIALGRQNQNVSADLKKYLEAYDWTVAPLLKTKVEKMIKELDSSGKLTRQKVAKTRGPATLPFPESPRAPPEKKPKQVVETKKAPKLSKAPKYVPGTYKPIEILSVQFGKKDEAPPKTTKKRERISITLDELRKEVDDPVFIRAFTKSSKDLMKAKVAFYTRRLQDAKNEYAALKKKIKRLKNGGVSERTIEDMYPGYPTMGAFIIDLESLIELVQKKGEDTTEEQIKNGLIEAIDDTEEGISSLIGRDEIKNQIASQLYSFSKGYKTFIGSFNNIAIYGSAGVGKTALAKVIAFVFSRVGILARDVVKIATRTELVGQYIGHTAPRTRSVLIETLEGVLFIDEAYQLTACPEEKVGSKDFGAEAVTELVNFLDKYIGMSIVIVAGYEGVMSRCFMTFNEGLPRRFPYRYILSPYSDQELTDILISNLKRKIPENVKIDQETSNFLFSMITKLKLEVPDALKNQAGDMLNLSAQLNKSITSSFKIKWKNGNLGNNIPIMLAGFDDFLNTKGYSVYG